MGSSIRDAARREAYDSVIVGSGPNGLAAAITLARAGRSVLVLEAAETMGGGARLAELTLPGFLHDVGSVIHPFAAGSPFFSALPLGEHGPEWISPPAALAHPFDDGTAALLYPSTRDTSRTVGHDAVRYRRLVEPFMEGGDRLAGDLLAPLRLPRRPLMAARFGAPAVRPARTSSARSGCSRWASTVT